MSVNINPIPYDTNKTVNILKKGAFLNHKVNRILKAYENHRQDDGFKLERTGNTITLSMQGKSPIKVDLDAIQNSSKRRSLSRTWQKITGTFSKNSYKTRLESFINALPQAPQAKSKSGSTVSSLVSTDESSSIEIKENDKPIAAEDICVFIEGDSENSNVTDRHRNRHEEKIYQALLDQVDVNPKTLTIKNQKFEFYDVGYQTSRWDNTKYYLQIDEKGAKKIIFFMERDYATDALKEWKIKLNSLPQTVKDQGTVRQKIENLNEDHLGMTAVRLANVTNFKPLTVNDFDYTYIPKPIQASEIEAEEEGELRDDDYCIYVEGESQVSDIVKRKRSAEEEAIYQAIQITDRGHPYSIIQKGNDLFYYVRTDAFDGYLSTSFYLQIDKKTGESKLIRSSFRNGFNDDSELTESFIEAKSNGKVIQTYNKFEDNQKTIFEKYSSVQNFNLDDIIKPSIRASQEFEVILENGLKETSDKACKVQPGRETITVKFGNSEKQWDKENFLSQIPHLNDTNESKTIYDFNELYANSTPMQVQFFTNYMNAIDAASTDYQKMTEAKLIRAYDFALKGDIPRMELLIAKEINERLMNNVWKNEQLLSYFKGHDGLGKVVPLYYPAKP